MQIEFEKKFILDLDSRFPMLEHIYSKRYGEPKIEHIWQCYGTKKENRFRAVVDHRTFKVSAVREVKKSVKVPFSYSVNLESDDKEIAPVDFMKKFAQAEKRLCKLRWTFRGSDMMDSRFPVDHKLMIDLFVPVPDRLFAIPHTFVTEPPYMLMAEVETILGVNTTALNLDFRLPSFLEPYCLKAVDKRDGEKAFTAYSLCYTPEVAESTKETVRKLKNG